MCQPITDIWQTEIDEHRLMVGWAGARRMRYVSAASHNKRQRHAINTTGSGKCPIFMLSTEGKSKEQIKAEAREALRRYQEAQASGDKA
jgi:hypothetical protein